MDDQQWLAERFERHRGRLQAVAYRMLGSLTEADDAVQEAWLRVSRADASGVDNLGAWLTTIVARVSLNMLRARHSRPEEPFGPHVPEPVIDPAEGTSPEHEVLLADAVGLGLLVVVQALSPPERLAYVLHDMFDMPFDEIAPIVERSPQAARQLASRARRRVRSAAPPRHNGDPTAQRAAVDAFLAAARDGDLDALIAVLHPDVVYRVDRGRGPEAGSAERRGARDVASQAVAFSQTGLLIRPALINGAPGIISSRAGQPFSVIGFTVTDGKITEIDILMDPDRLQKLDLSGLDDQWH
jgi:RNA polymerase sigma-70 factor (ECF subfamily)